MSQARRHLLQQLTQLMGSQTAQTAHIHPPQRLSLADQPCPRPGSLPTEHALLGTAVHLQNPKPHPTGHGLHGDRTTTLRLQNGNGANTPLCFGDWKTIGTDPCG